MYARRVKVETSIRDRYGAVNVTLCEKKKTDVNFIEGNVLKENVNIAVVTSWYQFVQFITDAWS